MTPTPATASLSPLILLGHGDEMFRRSLANVLGQGGNRVIVANDADSAFTAATTRRPDGIILDVELAQPNNFALCRALRTHAAVSIATPIILTTYGPASRTQQLAALRAGAWEVRGEPLDTEELLLRLAAYVQGKLEVERTGVDSLVDPASGLYSAAGVARRSEELAALTAREGMALACAVFRAEDRAGVDSDRLAVAFKQAGRLSDAIGRTGPTEFTVFAPATDEPAAERLVQRMRESVAGALDGGSLQAGYSAVTGNGRVSPDDLLAKARNALGDRRPAGG
jgi:DNA-binding response OmpR family regulator